MLSWKSGVPAEDILSVEEAFLCLFSSALFCASANRCSIWFSRLVASSAIEDCFSSRSAGGRGDGEVGGDSKSASFESRSTYRGLKLIDISTHAIGKAEILAVKIVFPK